MSEWNWWPIALVTALVVGIGGCAADVVLGTTVETTGEVVETAFEPSRTGWTYGGKGGMRPVTYSEQRTVMLRTEEAGIIEATASRERFFALKKGQYAPLVYREGRWSHYEWGAEVP